MLDGNKIKHQFVQTEMEGFLRDIDAHTATAIRFWLRNLAKHHRSFYLPLSHDSFYPDFVGELTDGRLFAVEYKCEHLRNAKDTLEKDAIGRLWAAKSSGKCLYATVYKSDGGLDVKGQLDLVVRAANRGRSVR